MRGEMHQIKFLPQEYSQNITDILIWDDNIALITFQQPIFGTVLNNKLLAETFRIIFQVMWDGLQR